MEYDLLNPETNEIRVLRLQAASDSDSDVQCDLFTTSLDSALPQYEALSYVWGSPKSNATMILRHAPFSVTTNLHSALKNLRYPDRERCLWIDALCIDQSNLQERSEQVPKMGLIYQRAQSVAVWLGEAWAGSDLAIDFLQQLGTDNSLHPYPSSEPHVKVKSIALDSEKLQTALVMFFTLPWWSRVWTVQEFVLAQRGTFQCGRELLDAATLRQAVRNYFDHEGSTSCCARETMQASHLFKALYVMDGLNYTRLLLDNTSLIYSMAQYRSRQATNLQDKIYGMLGLDRRQYVELVRPDYTLTIEETFERAVISIIRRSGSLEIFSHLAALGGERNPKLASFVPDWSLTATDTYVYPDWLNWVGHLNLYNAAKGEPAHLTSVAPGKIGLEGIEVDRIADLTSVLHYPVSSRKTLLIEMQQLARVETDADNMYCNTTESQRTAFWSTMCGTLEKYTDPERENRPFYRRRRGEPNASSFSKWEAWFPVSDVKGLDPDIADVTLAFKVASASKRFAVTEKGYMGFVPENCKRGDVVTILAGGSVPIVLRPISDILSPSSVYYQVLGDAYIHGVMDGELFQGEGEGRLLQEFILI